MCALARGCQADQVLQGRGRARQEVRGGQVEGAARAARSVPEGPRAAARRAGDLPAGRLRGVPQGEARGRRGRPQALRGGPTVRFYLLSRLVI